MYDLIEKKVFGFLAMQHMRIIVLTYGIYVLDILYVTVGYAPINYEL